MWFPRRKLDRLRNLKAEIRPRHIAALREKTKCQHLQLFLLE